jgi:hypothetical protein
MGLRYAAMRGWQLVYEKWKHGRDTSASIFGWQFTPNTVALLCHNPSYLFEPITESVLKITGQ